MESSSSSSFSNSSSGSDLTDDASSSCTSSPSGPLFELSDLMSQLPIKKGLSKFYNGKSQTFGSLANVKSIEDLAKETSYYSYNERMKSFKSYMGSLKIHKFSPKPTIRKRSTSVNSRSLSLHFKC